MIPTLFLANPWALRHIKMCAELRYPERNVLPWGIFFLLILLIWLHWVFIATHRLGCPEACRILVPRPCPEACRILVPRPWIELAYLALKGEVLTNGPPGKFPLHEWSYLRDKTKAACLHSSRFPVSALLPDWISYVENQNNFGQMPRADRVPSWRNQRKQALIE